MTTFDSVVSLFLGGLCATYTLGLYLIGTLYRKNSNRGYLWLSIFLLYMIGLELMEAHWGTLRNRSKEDAFLVLVNLLAVPMCGNALLGLVTTHIRKVWQELLHILPFGIAIVPTVFLEDDSAYALAIDILAAAYSLVITFLVIFRAHRYTEDLKNYYSSIEGRTYEWIYWLLGLLFVMVFLWLAISTTSPGWEMVGFLACKYVIITLLIYFVYAQKPSEAVMEQEEDVKEADLPEFFRLIDEKLPLLEADRAFFTNPSLTIQDMAMYVGTNRTYMSQYLNHIKKNTFYDYINNLRINYACKLLTETDIPVENLAIMAGFGSVSVFRRCMREKFDCTPSKYRQAMRTYK